MIRGIHHIGIHTRDIDRLRAFYEQAFAFTVVDRERNLRDYPEAAEITGVQNPVARFVLMKAPNCFLELFEWSPASDRQSPPLRPNDLGYTHFGIEVDDIESEYRRLSRLGMEFSHHAPVKSGPNASVYGRDPDGNIIEIQQIPAGAGSFDALTRSDR